MNTEVNFKFPEGYVIFQQVEKKCPRCKKCVIQHAVGVNTFEVS